MSRAAHETIVRMGEYAVARREGALVALGLGSCVAFSYSNPPLPVKTIFPSVFTNLSENSSCQAGRTFPQSFRRINDLLFFSL